jgi:hypothetical protein
VFEDFGKDVTCPGAAGPGRDDFAQHLLGASVVAQADLRLHGIECRQRKRGEAKRREVGGDQEAFHGRLNSRAPRSTALTETKVSVT